MNDNSKLKNEFLFKRNLLTNTKKKYMDTDSELSQSLNNIKERAVQPSVEKNQMIMSKLLITDEFMKKPTEEYSIDSIPILDNEFKGFKRKKFVKVHYKKPLVLSNINDNTVFKYKGIYDYDYSLLFWEYGLCNDFSYEEEYYDYIEKNIYNIDNEILNIVGHKFNTEQMIFNGIKIDRNKQSYVLNHLNEFYNKLQKIFGDNFELRILYGHKVINKNGIRYITKEKKYNFLYSNVFNSFITIMELDNVSITISLDAAYEILSKHKNLSMDYKTIRFINNKMIYNISDNIYAINDGYNIYISLDDKLQQERIYTKHNGNDDLFSYYTEYHSGKVAQIIPKFKDENKFNYIKK